MRGDRRRLPVLAFYARRGEPGTPPVEVGRAALEADGTVALSGAIVTDPVEHERFSSAAVFDRHGQLLTPADGYDYLVALTRNFRGSYFWAQPVPGTGSALWGDTLGGVPVKEDAPE